MISWKATTSFLAPAIDQLVLGGPYVVAAAVIARDAAGQTPRVLLEGLAGLGFDVHPSSTAQRLKEAAGWLAAGGADWARQTAEASQATDSAKNPTRNETFIACSQADTMYSAPIDGIVRGPERHAKEARQSP